MQLPSSISGTTTHPHTQHTCSQVSKLLQYSPQKRCTAVLAMTHPFFDELREPGTKLPNGESVCTGVGVHVSVLQMRIKLQIKRIWVVALRVTWDFWGISCVSSGSAVAAEYKPVG